MHRIPCQVCRVLCRTYSLSTGQIPGHPQASLSPTAMTIHLFGNHTQASMRYSKICQLQFANPVPACRGRHTTAPVRHRGGDESTQ